MDWRHNQWVGVGAAVLMVVAIVGVFLWMQGGSTTLGVGPGMTFSCDSTQETFKIPGKDLDKRDVYLEYFDKAGEAVTCKVCGQKDAYWVYWCPECQAYYKMTSFLVTSDVPRCPKGHDIDIYAEGGVAAAGESAAAE